MSEANKEELQWKLVLCVLLSLIAGVHGAGFIVAAFNSPSSAKARADLVCDGKDDQVELAASLRIGPFASFEFDDNKISQAYSTQSVEWLPGDYNLSASLVLPQVVDTALHAEGTQLHYKAADGDAVILSGSYRSKFYFGTIWSGSSGSALAFKDRPYAKPFMPNNHIIVQFQGLQQVPPNGNRGIGIYAQKHFCLNKIEGTDIRGFAIGVYVDDEGEGKVDTNWWWLSYVRGCGTNILVKGNGVDSQQWNVNVDSTIPGSVAIRTGAQSERWHIIMGTLDRSPSTRSIILDGTAALNIFEITPPLWQFDGYENHATATNNVFVQVPQSVKESTVSDRFHLVHQYQLFPDGPGLIR